MESPAARSGHFQISENPLNPRRQSRNWSDRIGVLIQGGLPDGARIAHKHGWITENDGYIHTIGDSAIVYSPRGHYVLSIFMHHPVQLVWESANLLFAKLSNAVYNYYNQYQ